MIDLPWESIYNNSLAKRSKTWIGVTIGVTSRAYEDNCPRIVTSALICSQNLQRVSQSETALSTKRWKNLQLNWTFRNQIPRLDRLIIRRQDRRVNALTPIFAISGPESSGLAQDFQGLFVGQLVNCQFEQRFVLMGIKGNLLPELEKPAGLRTFRVTGWS